MPSILITQCLQNDFVQPIEKYDKLPNLLHIGYNEARRLMGINPIYGPFSVFMDWANRQADDNLEIIHIRDWHDDNDPDQKNHLLLFGNHCIKNTKGAEFAFTLPPSKKYHVVDATGLNDFSNTNLNILLSKYKDSKTNVGIVGVWTEAKVFFLAYELITRYPQFNVAICSALSAGQSIIRHHAALEQMKKILNLSVFNSCGEFCKFLVHDDNSGPLPSAFSNQSRFPELIFESDHVIEPEEEKLIHYLFKECKSVKLTALGGGFSGSKVFIANSIDLLGRNEVPHVVKINSQEDIGKERTAFEKVESLLGNNAPMIVDFADFGNKGCIKYRYASMGNSTSTVFQKKYMSGADLNEIKSLLKTIFEDQLGRLYKGKSFEHRNLLHYYGFNPKIAVNIKDDILKLGIEIQDGKDLFIGNGITCPNVHDFYTQNLENLLDHVFSSNFYACVHGDLNGKNITIDEHNNVWLIDFSHTNIGHILKDLLKFENDLLYIFTPLNNYEELEEAIHISKIIFSVQDLEKPLPAIPKKIKTPSLIRAYETLKVLRSFYPKLIESDRNPLQSYIGLLRYSTHTLRFDESNYYQKIWALYNSGHYSKLIESHTRNLRKLRIDWIKANGLKENSIGLTILPGRKDWSRDLEEDIKEIKNNNITKIINLITVDELNHYGVNELNEVYIDSGFEVYHIPIFDQSTPSIDEINGCIAKISGWLKANEKIMIHCVGGLGRSGLVVACYLKSLGIKSSDSIKIVRKNRSPRAIETKIQERFVMNYIPLQLVKN
ncbi:MAG: isochorismatase family protein, partial [Bacteroidetes bacterium]|nr:isochorismatase family protein [Bacteroidota bacterium]